MEYASFDESESPVINVTFNLSAPTKEQFIQFIDGQKRLLSYKKEFVLLMDARKMGFLSSEIRITQGTFFKEFKIPLQTYCLGAVILVSSPIVKMMLRGMMLIAKPPNSTLISSNETEARRLADNIVSKKALVLSEENIV